MLVVTANWAVADGSLVTRPRREQVEWLATVRRAAIRAGVGRDGRYAPLERLDVVLAGDTFDALTSVAWLGGVRPWHEGRRAADVAARVLVAAAAGGRRLLGGLARWARTGLVVPAADTHGRPDWARPRRLPVRVALLPGDRDRWIAAALPRLARRGIDVAAAWSADGIAICHGAEFDPVWSGADGPPEPGRPTLGESLAVDLVARFAAASRADAAWPETRGLVARLASARPFEMPAVVAAWRAAADRFTARDVRDRWLAAIAGWRRAARVAPPSCGVDGDPLDAIAAWLEGSESTNAAAGQLEMLLAAAVPRPPRGTVVLGHPPATCSAAAVVCLGPLDTAVEGAADDGRTGACIVAARPGSGPRHVVFSGPTPAAGWAWLGDAAAERRAVAVPGIVEAA